jgi:hypothetical protein
MAKPSPERPGASNQYCQSNYGTKISQTSQISSFEIFILSEVCIPPAHPLHCQLVKKKIQKKSLVVSPHTPLKIAPVMSTIATSFASRGTP